jgi:hypothetical protein
MTGRRHRLPTCSDLGTPTLSPVTFNNGCSFGTCYPDGILISDPIGFEVDLYEFFFTLSEVAVAGPNDEMKLAREALIRANTRADLLSQEVIIAEAAEIDAVRKLANEFASGNDAPALKGGKSLADSQAAQSRLRAVISTLEANVENAGACITPPGICYTTQLMSSYRGSQLSGSNMRSA